MIHDSLVARSLGSGAVLIATASLSLASAAALGDDLTVVEQSKLVDENGGHFDFAGLAVAVSGDTAVVGSIKDDDACPSSLTCNSGSVVVHVRSGGVWTQQVKLLAADGAASDEFGWSVAIDGDTVLVGTWHHDGFAQNGGAVYVFVRQGTTWSQQAELFPLAGEADDGFGYAVALDGDTAVISAIGDDEPGSSVGAAYVFDRVGTVWTETAKLFALDGEMLSGYGTSVSIDGDRLAVGTPSAGGTSIHHGAIYVYQRVGATWVDEATLIPDGAIGTEQFGYSVAVEGDTIIGGRHYPQFDIVGSAYVFERIANVWQQVLELRAPDPQPGDQFGRAVSLSGDIMVIGAHGSSTVVNRSGSVHVYQREVSGWTAVDQLVASDTQEFDAFGYSVAIDAGTIVAGATDNDQLGTRAGAAYAFVVGDEVATPFCFGDGSSAACPCGNSSAAGLGEGCVNSTGRGARIGGLGTVSVAADDLAIYGTSLPPGQPTLLFLGDALANGGLGGPFGDGLLCIGGSLVRLDVNTPDASGHAAWIGGAAALAGIASGQTLHFQAWYRDPVGGTCGNGFSLTNAVGVVFGP